MGAIIGVKWYKVTGLLAIITSKSLLRFACGSMLGIAVAIALGDALGPLEGTGLFKPLGAGDGIMWGDAEGDSVGGRV